MNFLDEQEPLTVNKTRALLSSPLLCHIVYQLFVKVSWHQSADAEFLGGGDPIFVT